MILQCDVVLYLDALLLCVKSYCLAVNADRNNVMVFYFVYVSCFAVLAVYVCMRLYRLFSLISL